MASAANAGYGGDADGSTGGEVVRLSGKEKVRKLLDTSVVQVTLIVATFLALFSEDVRLLMEKGADPPMHALTIVVFVLFAAELGCTLYINKQQNCKPPFFDNRFYTFLDFVATASLIMDFWFVQEAMRGDPEPVTEISADTPGVEDNAVLTRASRAARAGTKIGRLLKLTRLMRVSKLVSLCSKSKKKEEQTEEQPSDMGRRMAEIITGKVILIVLVMLFAMPYLEQGTVDDFPSYGLDVVEMSSNLSSNSPTNILDMPSARDAAITYAKQKDSSAGRVIRVRCNNEDIWTAKGYAATNNDAREDFLSTVISTNRLCTADWDDTEPIREESWYSIWRTWFVVIMLGAGSVLFGKDATHLSERITIPLGVLSEDMDKVSQLHMEGIEQFHSNVREVNLMQDSFHKMKSGLVSFVKFMPVMVVRNLLKAGKETGLGVERKYLTIFFSNIANFDEVSEKMETLVLMDMLSEYFGEMAKILESSNGTLIEFVGDEILALWNAPADVANHEAACADAALKMQKKVEETFNERWKKKGWPWLDVKIGINAATVFVGNLGAPDRMKFGVLGDGVNMAARLQMLNRRYKSNVMLTEAVATTPQVIEVNIPTSVPAFSIRCYSRPVYQD